MNGLIKEVAQTLPDSALLGTIALVAFFLVYTGMLVWTLSRRRDEFTAAAGLPLGDDSPLAPTARR